MGYQVIEQVVDAFCDELRDNGDPLGALSRLSEEEAVRILTIHKCKGLEFEKVVVIGVERELFWSHDIQANRAEFFVAISRAKDDLVLTWAQRRPRPTAAAQRWDEARHPHREFLEYAAE